MRAGSAGEMQVISLTHTEDPDVILAVLRIGQGELVSLSLSLCEFASKFSTQTNQNIPL